MEKELLFQGVADSISESSDVQPFIVWFCMEKAQLLHAVVNNVSEGIMALDKDWHIVLWNNAAERITGFHKEEVLGRECTRLFRSGLCQKHCLLDRALSCGQTYQDVEAVIHNKARQLVHLLVSAAPLYDGNGDIIGGLETFRDVSQYRWMQQKLQKHLGYKDIVGRSEAMMKVFDSLASLMKTNTTVLLQGESGTGKELIARALHFCGPRRDKSFVAVNCSAIPEGMLESELFGHVKGAFTGAVQTHIGKFELANGGTLFLDEIAEISPSVQVKLLRVLEEREFQRLGDNKSIKVDIRLIAATNSNLYTKVVQGSFRDDLYYRLNVFPLDLPPLRERPEDIPLLVNHFIGKFNKELGGKIQGLSDGVLEIFKRYSWPGNVRELANAIECAFIHCRGSLIDESHLPQTILLSLAGGWLQKGSGLSEALRRVEKELILKELDEVGWNRSLAARRLGISISTLWRRMEKHGITE